jgi:hypothetical protein
LAEGTYDFAVMDWQNHLTEEQQAHAFRFTAESSKEMFEVIRDFTSVRHDALYLRLLRQPDGVAIGRTAMPRLPSSRRKVITGAGLSNTTVYVSTTLKTVPTEHVMQGQAKFQLVIEKTGRVAPAVRPAGVTTPPANPVLPNKPIEAPKPPVKPELPTPGDNDE